MKDSWPHYHQLTRQVPRIFFSLEDMQVKNIKHNRPLYYTGYKGSTQVNCIQIDPGSVLSIISRRLMQLLWISLHRLTLTNTIIFGFNANNNHSLGKIRLRCQTRDLKIKVSCYVINVDTSYNIFLERP